MVVFEDAAFLLVLEWMLSDICIIYIFGQGKNYEKDDIGQRFFPTNWDKVYDHLGDGCMVQYPTRICLEIAHYDSLAIHM